VSKFFLPFPHPALVIFFFLTQFPQLSLYHSPELTKSEAKAKQSESQSKISLSKDEEQLTGELLSHPATRCIRKVDAVDAVSDLLFLCRKRKMEQISS